VEKIISAKLIAIRDGVYTMYVFRNLDNDEYLMCTKLPNWQTPDIIVGDCGFLQVEIVKAGEEYYDLENNKQSKYLYSNIYFKNFIKNTVEITENSEIVL
jgi:hypothetical protein